MNPWLKQGRRLLLKLFGWLFPIYGVVIFVGWILIAYFFFVVSNLEIEALVLVPSWFLIASLPLIVFAGVSMVLGSLGQKQTLDKLGSCILVCIVFVFLCYSLLWIQFRKWTNEKYSDIASSVILTASRINVPNFTQQDNSPIGLMPGHYLTVLERTITSKLGPIPKNKDDIQYAIWIHKNDIPIATYTDGSTDYSVNLEVTIVEWPTKKVICKNTFEGDTSPPAKWKVASPSTRRSPPWQNVRRWLSTFKARSQPGNGQTTQQ